MLALIFTFALPFARAAFRPSCQLHLVRHETVKNQRSAEFERAQDAVADAERALEDLKSRGGFRERLGGAARFLGGDADLAREIQDTKSRLRDARKLSSDAREALDRAEAEVVAEAKRWLSEHEPDFAAQLAHHATLCALVDGGAECLTAVVDALDRVKSARTYDLWAGATDNKGADLMAAYKTSRANDHIAEVQRKVAAFRAQLDAYSRDGANHRTLDASHLRGIDVNQQLTIDFLTNTGFMDIMNYFRLGKEADALRDLREKVTKIHGGLTEVRARIGEVIDERVRRARGTTGLGVPGRS